MVPTDGVDYIPGQTLFSSLGNQVWAEITPRGPEFLYEDPWFDDSLPPVVLSADDNTMVLIYAHPTDDAPDAQGSITSVYARKLTYDDTLTIPASALELPGAGGSASAARAGTPPSGARFDGAPGSYADADPDLTHPFVTTDDLDIRMRILPDDWTPASEQILIEKWVAGDACFRLSLRTNGRLYFQKADDDGTTIDSTECTAAITFTPGQPKWIRVTCFSGYQIKFWQADDDLNWTQVGASVNAGFAGLNMDSAASLFLGAGSGADLATPTVTTKEFAGTIYDTEIYVDGGWKMFESLFATRSGGWVAGDTNGDDIEIENTHGTSTLALHGGVEIRSILDLTHTLDVRLLSVNAEDWTPAARSALVADDNWELSIEPSGVLRLSVLQDTATPLVAASSSVATGFGNGTPHHIRVTWDTTTDVVKFYTADPDPAPAWVQIGTDQSLVVSGAVVESTGALRVGSASGGSDPFAGSLARVDLYLGDRVAVPVFSTVAAGTTSFTDGAGIGWTVTGDASIVDVGGSTIEGLAVSDEVLLWGGGAGEDAVPPLPGGDWAIDYYISQFVPVDAEHFIFRGYDEDGWFDSELYGTGDYNTSIGCALVTVDWDAKTVDWGPWNIYYQVEETAWESSYGDTGLTSRRLVMLPDGRFVTATTDWADMSPALRVGTMNYGTGVATFGTQWMHPDSATDSNWFGLYAGMDLFLIDDTRVALFWKNYEHLGVHPEYPVNVAIFDIENDDTLTLVDWSYITYPGDNGEANFDDPTEYVTFEQVRPGVFVGCFYNYGGTWSYRELVSVDLADIVDNELTWSYLYGTPDDLDPVLYRSPSLWDYNNAYPEYHRIATLGDGKFVLTWQDYTTAIPRTGEAAEWGYTTVEIARGYVMEEDMSYVSTPAVLQASTSDLGGEFEVRERYLGGLAGGLSTHSIVCTATSFDHQANYDADPMPDPSGYTFAVNMVMKYNTNA